MEITAPVLALYIITIFNTATAELYLLDRPTVITVTTLPKTSNIAEGETSLSQGDALRASAAVIKDELLLLVVLLLVLLVLLLVLLVVYGWYYRY